MPFFQQALGRASDVANQPYIGYGGPRVAGWNSDQELAFDKIRSLADHQEMYNVGLNNIRHDLRGQEFKSGKNRYAGKNPYLDDMIGMAQEDVTDAYTESTLPGLMSQFQSGGAFGGTAHQQALANSQGELAEQLGDVSSTLRNADYNRQAQLAESAIDRQFRDWSQDRAFELQGLGMMPGMMDARFTGAEKLLGIGAMDQQLRQSALDTMYGDFQEWRDFQAFEAVLSKQLVG